MRLSEERCHTTIGSNDCTAPSIALLIRAAMERRHRVLLQVAYAGGTRVSELVSLNWDDVIERGRMQLNIVGKAAGSATSFRDQRGAAVGRSDADRVFVNPLRAARDWPGNAKTAF
jgi:integrase